MKKALDDFQLVKDHNNDNFSSFRIHNEAGDYSGCGYIYNKLSFIQRTA